MGKIIIMALALILIAPVYADAKRVKPKGCGVDGCAPPKEEGEKEVSLLELVGVSLCTGKVSLGNPPRGADKPLEADVAMNPMDQQKFQEGVKQWLDREENLAMGSSPPSYFAPGNPGDKIIQPIPDPLCPKGNICIQPLV